MKHLGIGILAAVFIAVALPTVYYFAHVGSPPTEPGGPIDGATVARSSGCRACHTIDGSQLVGPSWKGLAGSTVSLTGGTTVTADDAYLHESIVDPAAKIVQGYGNDMPATAGKSLSAQQITALIDYIKTLK